MPTSTSEEGKIVHHVFEGGSVTHAANVKHPECKVCHGHKPQNGEGETYASAIVNGAMPIQVLEGERSRAIRQKLVGAIAEAIAIERQSSDERVGRLREAIVNVPLYKENENGHMSAPKRCHNAGVMNALAAFDQALTREGEGK